MTLVVGCKIPWSTPGTVTSLRPNEVAFLLADSRWTYPDDPNRKDNEARKILRVHKSVALAYAGDVEAAERGCRSLKKALSHLTTTPVEEVAAAAQDAFADSFGVWGRPDIGLWVILAGIGPSKHGYLFYLSHDGGFRPIHLDGHPFPVGPRSICDAYRARLLAYEQEKQERGQPFQTAHDWFSASYAALDRLIQEKADPRVGGKIQAAVLDEDGLGEIEFIVLEEVATPPSKDKWRRAGKKLRELKTYLP
jgi:hypothetical protein